MLIKILLILIIIIYIFCLFYKFNENFKEDKSIKDKIIYGLKTIDDLFNKNNIYYTAAYGTLLGTVRHHDMIPWDDDGDLNIWRKDYDKIMSLKDEFKKRGLILESDWKLIKIYFNDEKYPFIDLFLNDIDNNKIVRCHEPYEKECKSLNKNENWWWKWVGYPSEWIIKRRKLKFGPIELWCPIESDKLLKYWYGDKYLVECKTQDYDHLTNKYILSKNITCNNLPKPQI